MTEILEVNGLDGYTRWYKDGVPHREDGPALYGKNGYEVWMKDGRVHREDGPAIISKRGNHWYLDGTQYSYEKWIKVVDQRYPKLIIHQVLTL